MPPLLSGYPLVFSDDFEREEPTPMQRYAAGGSASAMSGLAFDSGGGFWEEGSDLWKRDADGFYYDASVSGWQFQPTQIDVNNFVFEANIEYQGSGRVGFVLKLDTVNDSLFWLAFVSPYYNRIQKVVDWSASSVASNGTFNPIPGSNVNLKATISGDTLSLNVNDGEMSISVTDSDIGSSTNTFAALFVSNGTDPTLRFTNVSITSEENSPVDILLDKWWQEYPDGRATISTNYTTDGSKALRMQLNRDDPVIYGSKRAEVSKLVKETPLGEYWYRFRIYLPDGGEEDYALDLHGSEIIAQWHQTPDEEDLNGSPSLALRTGAYYNDADHYSIEVNYCPEAITTAENTTQVRYDLGSYLSDKGKWTDWIFHIKWGWLPEHNTICEIYKDGVLVLERNGEPNTFNDAEGVYQKLGIYKWDWAQPGYADSVLTDRVIYYDKVANYKVGTKPEGIFAKVNELWVPITDIYSKSSGEWVNISSVNSKVGETWK